MTVDRRYPWLSRVDEAPDGVRRNFGRTVDNISNRTGTRVLWNRLRRRYHFFKVDVGFGIFEFVPEQPMPEDNAVRIIQRTLNSTIAEKEAAADMARRDEEAESERVAEQQNYELSRDMAKDAVRMLERKQMGKHWRGSAVVNGSKA
jgi:hypothetical protein